MPEHDSKKSKKYAVHNVGVMGSLWYFNVRLGKKAESFRQEHNTTMVGIRLINSEEADKKVEDE